MSGQEASQPVDTDGTQDGPGKGSPASHGNPYRHFDGRQDADLGWCDNADLGSPGA